MTNMISTYAFYFYGYFYAGALTRGRIVTPIQ